MRNNYGDAMVFRRDYFEPSFPNESVQNKRKDEKNKSIEEKDTKTSKISKAIGSHKTVKRWVKPARNPYPETGKKVQEVAASKVMGSNNEEIKKFSNERVRKFLGTIQEDNILALKDFLKKNGSGVTDLDVRSFKLNDSDLKQVLNSCPNLVEFKFTACAGISKKSFEEIATLKHLEVLKLFGDAPKMPCIDEWIHHLNTEKLRNLSFHFVNLNGTHEVLRQIEKFKASVQIESILLLLNKPSKYPS